MNDVTVLDTLGYASMFVVTGVVLSLVALTVNRSSVRRSVDLSPISNRTPRSDCPVQGCTTVHPPRGRHRADPRPDGPMTIIVAAFATGFGLIPTPKGQHADYFAR